jgi:hypothetical protein
MSRVYLTPDGLAKCLPNAWPHLTELRRFPHTGAPWSALFAAQAWVKAEGLALAPPERELPIAILWSGAVPKWSKLTPADKTELAGVIYLEDPAAGYMNGAVAVRLRVLPCERAAAGGAS